MIPKESKIVSQSTSHRARVIPVLQLAGQDLVKTLRFQNPKYLGDPLNAVRIFNDSEADELIIIDIDATKEGRSPDFLFLESLAAMAQMPLAYGGGVSSSSHAAEIIRLGFEKIAVQSLLWRNPNAAREIAATLGSQALLVSIDCTRTALGFLPSITTPKKTHPLGSLQQAVECAISLGAGELLVSSIDREGTMLGPDTDLARITRELTPTPLIYNGGVSSDEDLVYLSSLGIDAIGVGSRFLFRDETRSLMISYPSQSKLRELFGTSI